MTSKRTILVTSALPYANNSLHIGHVLELRPNRHLGAVPAAARRTLLVRLRERRARHADDAARRAGRHRTGRPDRARERGAPARLRDLSDQRRQLHHDARLGERRAHVGALRAARRRAASSRARSSSRPTTRNGRCSCRTATCAARARTAARRINTATRARTAARPTRRSTSRTPSRRCPARSPSARESEHLFLKLSSFEKELRRVGAEARRRDPRAQARRVVQGRPEGLGHLARSALLRLRDPGRARTSSSTSGSTRRSATWRAS